MVSLFHSFDLPPTQKALPLPVTMDSKASKASRTSKFKKGKAPPPTSNKRHHATMKDDTPRAFKRLMQVAKGGRIRSGLDDGLSNAAQPTNKPTTETPQIRPGEDLRTFASRVDASLPISGLTNKAVVKDGKDVIGLKVRQTRREKKMHKLYDQWRAEEAKIQDRREEEADLRAEKELDDEVAGVSWNSVMGHDGASRKSGKKKNKSRHDSEDEDPWQQLKKKRGQASTGLHDVAQAPPELHKKQTRLLSVRNATVDVGSAPKSAGSLRQREEVEKTRKQIVDAYRQIREHEQRKLAAKQSE